jgi:hypothetical protein
MVVAVELMRLNEALRKVRFGKYHPEAAYYLGI